MTSALFIFSLLASASQDLPQYKTMCPLMANRPTTGRMAAEYAGFRIFVCCDKCLARIGGDPTQTIKKSAKNGELIGDFLFDPNSGLRIDRKEAKFSRTINAFIIYSKSELTDKVLDSLATFPERESYFSRISGKELKWSAHASAYIDVEKVRYYLDSAEERAKFQFDAKQIVFPASKPVVSHPYPIMGIDNPAKTVN